MREDGLDLEVLPQSESLFALSNGHLGWRGNLDEGEPNGLPGTYLNGVYEEHPLPHAEAGYGVPECGQTVVNVTNGKLFRLLVDDEPFDIRTGTLHHHERVLDLRTGLLHRTVEWTSPAGTRIRVRTRRLVSLTQRAVAAVEYEVELIEGDEDAGEGLARIVLQSELAANEPMPPPSPDPRAASVLTDPLESQDASVAGTRLRLQHRTKGSGLRVAAACDHEVTGPDGIRIAAEAGGDLARLTAVARLGEGERLRCVKTVAYAWSGQRSLPALHDEVDAALTEAQVSGWEGLCAEQRDYLADFWERADVEVEGDAEIQHAVRFALFHVLQAGARAEERPIPAKGLTGSGYSGHSFWDTEVFVLPVLTYTLPRAAAQVLRWRRKTLPEAMERAEYLGLAGAAFPWRTINGRECSTYWPAGTAAFHVNAGIADAAVRYAECTGDADFERETGLELLVPTARLWRRLGHTGDDGAFHIDGVTGPDEYSAVANDNTYTNLMAQANLRAAAAVVRRHPVAAAKLGAGETEAAAWDAAADAMAVPYDEKLGVHEQHAGFTRQADWDFESTGPEEYPLMLHHPYFDLYRSQVVKQADLVLAQWLRGECFTAKQRARDFAYYERLTVRDSSLSACCQAVAAADAGHPELAYDYLGESAAMDLGDLQHNTRDGLHLAALAGTWPALVAGFGGMRRRGPELRFAPRLPGALRSLAFSITVFGRRLRVAVRPDEATYTLVSGEPLGIHHYGKPLTLTGDAPQTCAIPPLEPRERPRQPPGRAPEQRRR
nr:glycosyl hydrolase family 65 protein [Streptomyces coryli]